MTRYCNNGANGLLGSRAGPSLRLATFLNLEARARPAELTGLQPMQTNRAREDSCMRAGSRDGG